MSEAPVIAIDLMYDNAAFLGTHKITPSTPFWAKAVASALKKLGAPLNASIVFRKQSSVVKATRLDYLLRENP